jgi:glycosyl transferase family 25
MEEILPAELDVVFTTNWEGPLDGRQIDRESLRGFGLYPWPIVSRNEWWSHHEWWSRPDSLHDPRVDQSGRLTKGEIGCAISHWRCWKDAWEQNLDRAIVFEDDVVLDGALLEKLSHALHILDTRHPAWDLLYLGRQRLHKNRAIPAVFTRDIPVEEGLVRPGYSYCAHAYVLSRNGLKKILSVGFESAIIHTDEFLPALYMIHPRADIARRYRPILEAFAIEPSIAYQLPREQAGSDTQASDFVDWAE